MELQVEKYHPLVKKLSSEFIKTNYRHYSREDLEQELWLKLYEFIKENSGEAENFPLIKSALRNHLLDFINSREVLLKAELDSVEDMISNGADLLYEGFDPLQEFELKEVGRLMNEWFQRQNEEVQRFMLECVKEMDGKRVFVETARKNANIGIYHCHRALRLLKKFLRKKGIDYVS
jgi:DNA-directed RNA polymerase specialized sigma24 family protein